MTEAKTIINIKKFQITTEETAPRILSWETLTKVTAKAAISKCKETECRKLNTVYGKDKSEDIVTGYDIETESQTLEAEVFALIDSGTIRYEDDESSMVIGYDAPPIGDKIERTAFTLSFYAENKDSDGTTKNYTKYPYFG